MRNAPHPQVQQGMKSPGSCESSEYGGCRGGPLNTFVMQRKASQMEAAKTHYPEKGENK